MQKMNNEELDSVLNDLLKGKGNIKENFINKINKMLDG